MVKKPTFYYRVVFTVVGFFFGSLFPIIAIFLQEDSHLLLGIIYTAPLFLGLFAYLGGHLQDKNLELETFNYKILLNSMSEGLIVQNADGAIIQYNPAALEILGLSPDELVARNSLIQIGHAVRENGLDFPMSEEPAIVALRTCKNVIGVIMGLKSSYKLTKWVRINAVYLNKMGESQVVVTFTDVSEQIYAKEENQYVLDVLDIGVWKFNPTTQDLYWDQSMYRLFEVDPSEFSGHYNAWESSLSQKSKEKAIKELNMALSGEKDFDTTFEIKTKLGIRKYIGGHGKVLRDAQGNPSMMYGINWDRSKEVMDANNQEKQRILFETVLSNLPNMVFVKDYAKNLSFTLLNKAGENLLGVRAEDVIGKNDYDFFPKEQADFFTMKDKEVFSSHKVLRIDKEKINSPKGLRFLKTYKVPTYNMDGSPNLLIGISSDITDEIELQNSLEKERAKVIQNAKLASLGEMSAGIAHEINNPLSIITGYLRLLTAAYHDPEKLKSRVEILEKSAERISKIVNGLRKFSRNSDKVEYKIHSLREILNETLILTEAKSKRHEVTIILDCQIEGLIYCDEVEIEQILINLINNGIDAVDTLKEKWVKISVFEEKDQIILQIRDSGKGIIEEEIKDKLFQPFFTTKGVGRGTGLGLSIVKGILDAHHATIELLSSDPNTCFEVRFPVPDGRET